MITYRYTRRDDGGDRHIQHDRTVGGAGRRSRGGKGACRASYQVFMSWHQQTRCGGDVNYFFTAAAADQQSVVLYIHQRKVPGVYTSTQHQPVSPWVLCARGRSAQRPLVSRFSGVGMMRVIVARTISVPGWSPGVVLSLPVSTRAHANVHAAAAAAVFRCSGALCPVRTETTNLYETSDNNVRMPAVSRKQKRFHLPREMLL